MQQRRGSLPPRRQGTVNSERSGSLIPPSRERHDLLPSLLHTTLAQARPRARTAEPRERSRTLTPPNTQTPKAPSLHFSLPSPLQVFPTCLIRSRPVAGSAGPSGPRPAQNAARRRSTGKKCQVWRKAAASGAEGGGVLSSQLPTDAPPGPQQPMGFGRRGRPVWLRRGELLGLGWERGEWPKRRGRMRGAPRGRGRGRSRAAEPAAGPRDRHCREVGELLGAHCGLSCGASRGASDLSPTGKASVWAPPPLPCPGDPHTVGSVAGGMWERPAVASSGREPRPHFPY